MNLNRKIIRRLSIDDEDDGYVNVDKSELLSFVWEITKDAWSFTGDFDVEQRLQRDVAAFIRRKS